MSVVAGIRALLEQGFTIEQALVAAEAFEPKKTARSAAAERQARYRARKKGEQSVTRDVTRDVTEASRDVTRDQKEMSPTPPIRKTTSSLRSDVDPPPPSGVSPTAEKQKRATRLPEDWVLPEKFREAARAKGLAESEIDRQAAKILNWSLSHKNGAKVDWFRAWLNWIDDCPRQAPRGSPNVTPIRRRNVAHMLKEMLEEENREREEEINSEAFERLPLVYAER